MNCVVGVRTALEDAKHLSQIPEKTQEGESLDGGE